MTKNKFFSFLSKFILFRICIVLVFRSIGIGGFSSTPIIRFFLILFTVLYFLKYMYKIKIPVKRKDRLDTGYFMRLWLFVASTGVLIGIVNQNPIIYILTDFIYIIIGFLLYYTVYNLPRNKLHVNYKVFDLLSVSLNSYALICFCFGIDPPDVLLVILMILTYLNLLRKKYKYAFFTFVIYMLFVVSSNRSQLIVFLFVLLLLLLSKIRRYLSLNNVIGIGVLSLMTIFFLKETILEYIIGYTGQYSSIGFRMNQVLQIIKIGVDYNNPYFTSIVQRILEVNAVWDYWLTNIITFIFGSGSGGVIDGTKLYSDIYVLKSSMLGATKVHNIHLLPFALIFRYGLAGGIIFLLLLKMVYKSIKLVINEKRDLQLIFWNMFFICWFLFSLAAASYLWTMPVFWISLAFRNFSIDSNEK